MALEKALAAIEDIAVEEGLVVLGWRDLPIHPDCLGATARAAMPTMKQFFVAASDGVTGIELDRKTFVARKRAEHELAEDLHDVLLVAVGAHDRLQGDADDAAARPVLPRPRRPPCRERPARWCTAGSRRTRSRRGRSPTRIASSPTTARSTPCRATRTGCAPARRWRRARICPNLAKAFPICTPGASDTARFDEVLELLHLAGRPIQHAILMMIPEAWENNADMDDDKRAFYRYHASIMEPWDGPASVTFTDGTVIGAVLDRNGLRPSRYWVTDDDLVVMASRSRRDRHRPRQGRHQGPTAARQDVPDRHRRGSHRRRRGDQGHARCRAAVRRVARAGHGRARRSAGARARRVQPSQRAAPPADVRLHARGAEDHRRADGAQWRRADRLDGHRHPDRRLVRTAAYVVRLLPTAVRAGHQPAARRDP